MNVMQKLGDAIGQALADPGDELFGLHPSQFADAIKALPVARLADLYAVNVAEYAELRAAMNELERNQRGLDPASPAVLALYAPLVSRWGNAGSCRRHRASSVTGVCGALALRVRALGEALEALYLAGTPRPAEQAAALKAIEEIDLQVVGINEEIHAAAERFKRAGGMVAPVALVQQQQREAEARAAKVAELAERRREAWATARRHSWVAER